MNSPFAKKSPSAPGKLTGFEDDPHDSIVAAKIDPSQSTPTPNEVEESCSQHLSEQDSELVQQDCTEQDEICDGENEDLALAMKTQDAILFWHLYVCNLAKQCKAQCPRLREHERNQTQIERCRCQSNSDKVLSALDSIRNGNWEVRIEDEMYYLRLSRNTLIMLEHFREWHHDVCTPNSFDFLGYAGLKLVQFLKKEEHRAIRDFLGSFLELQFETELDVIFGWPWVNMLLEHLPHDEEMSAKEIAAKEEAADRHATWAIKWAPQAGSEWAWPLGRA